MEGAANRAHSPGLWLTITFSACGADLGWVPGEIVQFQRVNGGFLSGGGMGARAWKSLSVIIRYATADSQRICVKARPRS